MSRIYNKKIYSEFIFTTGDCMTNVITFSLTWEFEGIEVKM